MKFYILEVFNNPEDCYFKYVNGNVSEHFAFIHIKDNTIEILFFTEHYGRCIDNINNVLNLERIGLKYINSHIKVMTPIKPCIKIIYRCKEHKEEIKEIIKKVLRDCLD